MLLESVAINLNQWGAHSSAGDPARSEVLLNNHKRSTALHSSMQRAKGKSYLGKRMMVLIIVTVLITCLSFVCACFGRWWDEDELRAPDPTLTAVENCRGPWAKAYRDSQGPRREAIELLFKCNIITMPEFAGYAVSRQHGDIDECVQIALRMLEDRSISEWEGQWQLAQKTFEVKAAEGGFYTPM